MADKKVSSFWISSGRSCLGEYNKFSAKKIRPLEIIEKINSNAYKLKLPNDIRTVNVFNVKHSIPYGDDHDKDAIIDNLNLRVNSLNPGVNDAD